ncbi:MAG: hypothetical protein K0S12_2321, partial [Bacteroidetes bacterium]|nr:hypothetical protein [Bacteroidota bacterium]
TAVNDFNLWAGGVQLVLKPVKWIGISNNIGYRFANERIVDGYYYSIGIWLGFKPIITDMNYYLKRKRYRAARAALMAG